MTVPRVTNDIVVIFSKIFRLCSSREYSNGRTEAKFQGQHDLTLSVTRDLPCKRLTHFLDVIRPNRGLTIATSRFRAVMNRIGSFFLLQ